MRDGVSRNDCEMVADLRVIENPLVRLYPTVVEHSARERVLKFVQCRFYRRDIIFRQCARIGTWISNGFVPLVQRLRDLQGALRGETEATVRFTLQAREIIQLRRDLRARLFFLQLNNAFFARALPLNRLGDFAMPQSGRSAVLVPERPVHGIKPLLGIRQIHLKPRKQSSRSLDLAFFFVERFVEPSPWIFAGCRAECADDLIQFARLEFCNLTFAIDDNGQRWRLHSPKRSDSAAASATESQRKCACRVDAHQPIRLVAASRRARKRLHLGVGTQSLEAVANGL